MICKKKIYFECIVPEQNRRAFYEVIIGQDLFGHILIRRWGRIGTKGQPRKQQRFYNEKDMLKEFERVREERIKHRYVVKSTNKKLKKSA